MKSKSSYNWYLYGVLICQCFGKIFRAVEILHEYLTYTLKIRLEAAGAWSALGFNFEMPHREIENAIGQCYHYVQNPDFKRSCFLPNRPLTIFAKVMGYFEWMNYILTEKWLRVCVITMATVIKPVIQFRIFLSWPVRLLLQWIAKFVFSPLLGMDSWENSMLYHLPVQIKRDSADVSPLLSVPKLLYIY